MKIPPWKIAIYVVIGIAIIALLYAGQRIAAGIIAAIAGMLFGRKKKALPQYIEAETEATAAHVAADAEHEEATTAIEADANDQHAQLRAMAQREAQGTTQAIDKVQTSEQLNKVAETEIHKAAVDRAKWEAVIGDPREDGFVRISFVLMLLLIGALGMCLGGHLAHSAPASPGEKARTKALIDSLQSCRHGGNRLFVALKKCRKRRKADAKKCKKKAAIEKKKNTKQKTILVNRPVPPVWPYVVVGVGAVIAASAIMLGVGYAWGSSKQPKP